MQDIDIGQITEALNDKMDLDSVNANPAVAKQSDLATLQNTVSQLQGALNNVLGRIDYTNASSSITLNPGNNKTQSYTVPSDGYIHATVVENNTSGTWTINNKSVVFSASTSPFLGNLLLVSQGDIITVASKAVGSTPKLTFIFYPQKS